MASIAILLPDLRGGGAERVNIDLAREFIRQGHTVDFVLMQARGELLDLVPDGARVVDLKTPRVRNMIWPLRRYLQRERPNALLAAMWPLTVLAPLVHYLSSHRCTVLVSEHNALTVQYAIWGKLHRLAMKASMALGYRLAAARVGVSGGVADDISRLSGLPRQMFSAIHNPVPTSPKPDEAAIGLAERLWACNPGARTITVGSLKAQKNHPLLLQAFAKLDRPDARLMFVGTGSGHNNLVTQAAHLGVADRVIFAGFHTDPSPFYATADLFVLSSDHEGFGNVIVEALGHGLPVVSTDCPSGPAEILENGRYGRLVPVGDAEALALAMEGALVANHDREALKRRAADFAPEIAAKKYLDLLFPSETINK